MRLCSYPGCGGKHAARDLCSAHLYQSRAGIPLQPVQRRAATPGRITAFWRLIARGPGCWLWLGTRMDTGYGRFSLFGDETPAHRLSWTLFRGPIPDGLGVLHRCDNRLCVNPTHLFLGTAADNAADMVAKGRHVGYRKVTEQDVVSIRARRAAGARNRDLAREYRVTDDAISAIARRVTWPHVP
jgi:hypothetical protein